jgi:hypothetical protein
MIEPHEFMLKGKWSLEGSKLVADTTDHRLSFILTPMMAGYGN